MELTQTEFATLFNVTRDNIASYERGSEPKISLVASIVDYFHITFEDLINIPFDKNIFQTKCAENVTLEKGNKKGNKKGDFPNVHNSLPFNENIFNSRCAKNTINQNDGLNDGVIDGFPNMQKTPSFEKNIFQTKCAKSLIKENDKINDKIIDKERNVQKILSIKETILETESTSTDLIEIPIADISAAAGYGAANSDNFDTNDVISLPRSMIGRGNHLCIDIEGRSMEPTLQSGSKAIIRQLDRGEWANIKTGNVYVITDREGNTYIKRIENQLYANGTIVMHSDNADKRRYAPFSLSQDELHNVWAVEWYLSSSIPSAYTDTDMRVDSLESEFREIKAMLKDVLKKS